MSLNKYLVIRDNFEYDCSSLMSFPCCVCVFKGGKANEGQCRYCGHNTNAETPPVHSGYKED